MKSPPSGIADVCERPSVSLSPDHLRPDNPLPSSAYQYQFFETGRKTQSTLLPNIHGVGRPFLLLPGPVRRQFAEVQKVNPAILMNILDNFARLALPQPLTYKQSQVININFSVAGDISGLLENGR